MGGFVGRNLALLGPVTVCLGLRNSDDPGAYFDLRVDLLKNGVTITTGEAKDIRYRVESLLVKRSGSNIRFHI
jgi:hypothetical protein